MADPRRRVRDPRPPPDARPAQGCTPLLGGRYARLRAVGHGAQGEAMLVRSLRSGCHFVLKTAQVAGLSPAERAHALREATLLRQLSHPNVLRYRECFSERGRVCLVTEFCAGGDLAAALSNRRGAAFPEAALLDWLVQICLGLDYLHRLRILHRDVKPANIFLSAAGVAKLGDFGIARVLAGTAQPARTFCGTPHYMSPELCDGGAYDARSDMWSLGVTLYELMQLRRPFEASNLALLRMRIISGVADPLPAAFSPDLRALCGTLMEVDAARRPRAEQILADPFVRARIRAFLAQNGDQGERLAAPPPREQQPCPQLPPPPPRRPRPPQAPVAPPPPGAGEGAWRQRRGAHLAARDQGALPPLAGGHRQQRAGARSPRAQDPAPRLRRQEPQRREEPQRQLPPRPAARQRTPSPQPQPAQHQQQPPQQQPAQQPPVPVRTPSPGGVRVGVPGLYEALSAWGVWWPVVVEADNGDGSYAAKVMDAVGTFWPHVHRHNLRLIDAAAQQAPAAAAAAPPPAVPPRVPPPPPVAPLTPPTAAAAAAVWAADAAHPPPEPRPGAAPRRLPRPAVQGPRAGRRTPVLARGGAAWVAGATPSPPPPAAPARRAAPAAPPPMP